MSVTDKELEGLAVIAVSLATTKKGATELDSAFNLLERIKAHYPKDIFSYESADLGVRFVWAMRNEVGARTAI